MDAEQIPHRPSGLNDDTTARRLGPIQILLDPQLPIVAPAIWFLRLCALLLGAMRIDRQASHIFCCSSEFQTSFSIKTLAARVLDSFPGP
jgi:hypothetical protein